MKPTRIGSIFVIDPEKLCYQPVRWRLIGRSPLIQS
jgi:hypothetical protein